MQRLNHRTNRLFTGLIAAAAGLACSTAQAQPEGPGNDYCVRHTFRLTTNGNLPPAVFFGYYAKAYARTNTCKDAPSATKGIVQIGAGVTSFTSVALAPGSYADAEAKATITTLAPGVVAGTTEANGNADPTINGCPPPAPPRGVGWARGSSAAGITIRGRKIDRKGRIKYRGSWKHVPPVRGSTERGTVRDPIVARLYDNTANTVEEWTLLSIMTSAADGEVAWDNDVLSNSSSNMSLHMKMDSPITVEQGELKIEVEDGIVTELVQLGLFSALPLPSVGSGGGFAVDLPELSMDFDMGGNPDNDLVPEIDVDGGGEVDELAAGLDANGTLITDIGVGHDRANISQPIAPDASLGFPVSGPIRLADFFEVAPGDPWMPEILRVPVYQDGAPAEDELHAAFVEIWAGPPGFGALIAGNMFENRLVETDFADMYRVDQDVQSDQRAIREAIIDMTWVPPLAPGQYAIVLNIQGNPQFGQVFVPPAVWSGQGDQAAAFNQGQWMPLQDQGSGRAVSLPFRLHGQAGHPGCYADCNGDGQLNLADFGCFQTKFALNDPYADCNGDGALNLADFGCFQTRFALGCQ